MEESPTTDKAKAAEELKILRKLYVQEEANSHFSWGKGIVLGIIGKVAGTAIVTSVRESFKGQLRSEVVNTPAVRSALSHATPEQSKQIMDGALTKAMAGMRNMRGSMLRHPWAWAAGGGAAGGLGALGIEYASHLTQQKKTEERLEELKGLERSWEERVAGKSADGRHL